MKKSNKLSKPIDQNIGDWVILKNNQFIVFNKPPTIAVQSDKTKDKCLKDLAEIYTKQKLFLCNRIDRPASGLVIYAKNKKAAAFISNQFQSKEIQKTYLAVVKAPIEKKNAHLIDQLEKNEKLNKSFIVKEATKHSKLAELKYNLLDTSDNYSLLEIDLITGRHHQIRAQLANIGQAIKGDVKYGFRRSNKDRSIHLHAWKMSFKHPISKEMINLKAPFPKEGLWDFFLEKLN